MGLTKIFLLTSTITRLQYYGYEPNRKVLDDWNILKYQDWSLQWVDDLL